MIDDVAKALCKAAGTERHRVCIHCEGSGCTMWPEFRQEARAAISEAYRWWKKERRWPQFAGKD